MNGMNFKPFINKVLDSLSDEQVAALYNLMATHSNSFTNRSLINAANLLTSSDKGIGLFTIQLDSQNIKTGYLIYNNSYCVLLSYVSNSERVMEYEIDMSTMTYKPVKEFLTTDYLRHEVAIRATAAEGEVTEWEKAVSSKLRVDDDNIEVDDALVIKDSDEDAVVIYTDTDSSDIKRVSLNGLVSNGDVEIKGKITIGSTSLTEEQLQALLALLS